MGAVDGLLAFRSGWSDEIGAGGLGGGLLLLEGLLRIVLGLTVFGLGGHRGIGLHAHRLGLDGAWLGRESLGLARSKLRGHWYLPGLDVLPWLCANSIGSEVILWVHLGSLM